ncbi:MAG: PaaI family thioesterase [Pseudomonadota bacterium]
MVLKAQFEMKTEYSNAAGVAHGGILAVVLDEVTGVAIVGAANGRVIPSTLSMMTSYLSPGRIGRTYAQAKVLKAGKTIVFATAELLDGDNNTVGRAEQVCRLIRSK